MVVAPHGRLAAGNLPALWNVIPAVRAVVDGVEEQSVVIGIEAEVGFGEEGLRGGEAGGRVACPLLLLAVAVEVATQTEKSLRADRSGGAVDRLVVVEGVGWPVVVIDEVDEARGAGVPVGDAVSRGLADVELSDRLGNLEEAVENRLLAAERREFRIGKLLDVFHLLGVTAKDPGKAARPGGEGGVTLLGGGTAVVAVVDVEDRLVDDAPWQVVHVASLAVVDIVAGRGLSVLDDAGQQGGGLVVLPHEAMTEGMGNRECAQGADRVREERVRAVEGVDVAEFRRDLCPARCLDGAAGLQGQIIEVPLPLVGGKASLLEKSA